MSKPPEIPFSYGDVIAVTGQGTKIMLWFQDPTGVIRGIPADITNPTAPVLFKDEVLFKRRTEGRTRKSKLPPVGTPVDTSTPKA